MFRKKIPFGRSIPLFFFGSSEFFRVLNYLNDSNSILRAGRIISEDISGGTVKVFSLVKSKQRSMRTGLCTKRMCVPLSVTQREELERGAVEGAADRRAGERFATRAGGRIFLEK